MKIVFIEYPKCSTCIRAKKWLQERKIDFEDRNIITETPKFEELKTWVKEDEIKKWFNTSGIKYRELGLKEKLETMTFDEKLKLLSTDGMLIKRPVLIVGEKILLGFKEKNWSEIL